jgi:DNA-binding Lrp family transcriptional regulator
LRDAIFSVLKDRVWHRTKERPSKQHEQLFEREYLLLKELADDASQEFSAIDRKLGFGKGASQYTYHRLLEKDIVKRITITMDKPPIRYVGIIHADQINMRRFMESRKELFIDRIAHTDNALNRYLLSADFGSPYGILMLAPVFGDSGIALMEKSLKSRIKGIRVRSLVVTDVLVGRIGYRRFDNRHSKAYKTLKETYGYTEEELERLLYPGK